MTAARRLAAILAADIVGYSRLMGEDEAGRRRRRRCVNGLKRRGRS
jgi:class 3 adenylate cyclase